MYLELKALFRENLNNPDVCRKMIYKKTSGLFRNDCIADNQKERNRLDQNALQLKRENEANLAKIKQLTADLQKAQNEIQNQEKLLTRLRNQIGY